MFRKLIVSLSLAAATLTASTLPADAAQPNAPHDFHRHRGYRFEVFVNDHGCWELARTFYDGPDAYRFAAHLERRGVCARVEKIWIR